MQDYEAALKKARKRAARQDAGISADKRFDVPTLDM